MIYPIYDHKRCRRRDQIGMYDDSGYVYSGRKLPREGRPDDGCIVGRFDGLGRIYHDVYLQQPAGLLSADGKFYEGDRVSGAAAGYVDENGWAWKGKAHNIPVVYAPQGRDRQLAAAAAALLLRTDVAADASAPDKRFDDLPRWLEILLDIGFDLLEAVIDAVT